MALHNYPYPSLSWQYQGIDFAGMGTITPQLAQDMYDDGIRFVGRYLYSSQYPNGKGISAEEAQIYLDAGLSIYFYYEVNTTDALGGYNVGYQNGLAALAEATALNVPHGTQIYCCCDTGVTQEQANGVVMDYLDGFADALPDYNIGIYGGVEVMKACYDAFPANLRCQAGAWGSEEFEPIDARQWLIASLRSAILDGYVNIQNVTLDANGYPLWRGHSVDLCSAPSLDNMWNTGSPTPPTPPSPTGNHKMPFFMYLKLPL